MTRGILAVVSVLVYVSSLSVAQNKIRKIELSEITGSAPEATKREILTIEEEHSKAVYDKDATALNRLLTDNWAYTNERGEVLSKEQWINNITKRKFAMDTIVHDDIRMDQFGDTVIVMGRSTSTLHYQGKESKGPRRFELVFVKQDGSWKLAGHFVSLVPHD